MVALVVYTYCVGERSSRQIERRCVEDVAFRVIAANRAPDHSHDQRGFGSAFAGPLAGLFDQVLGLCARAGMVRVGTVAIDGTKMARGRGAGQPTARYAAIARRGRADPRRRPNRGRRGRGRALRRRRAATSCPPSWPIRARDARVWIRSSASWRPSTRRAKPNTSSAWPSAPRMRPRPANGSAVGDRNRLSKENCSQARRNVTDPDSRIMSHRGALVQAYNAQAVVGARTSDPRR